jgi:hypothetical protein
MTLIIKKFPYQTISRKTIDGKRIYECPDTYNVPSVTTILDQTKDKTHLINWRKRVGEAAANNITTEAAGVGTRMHTYLEKYMETGIWPTAGSNPYAQQAYKMASVIKEQAFTHLDEIWGSEINLYFPKIYAGTSDLIGVYKGNESINDFKQTNNPKKKEWVDDYFLQLVAYLEAHNEVYGTNIREGHIFMVSRDLEYQQFDLWPSEYDLWRTKWWERVETYFLNQV